MVSKEKSERGKAFIFRPSRHHCSTFRGLVKDLLLRVFHGDGVALVASLFESKAPTPEQIDQLERMLADLRKAPPSKTGKGP